LFQTSKIDPFSSNVAFVLFKDLRVALYHNEKLVQIPGCNEMKCNFAELKSIFNERLLACNFDQICDNNSDSKIDENLTIDDRY